MQEGKEIAYTFRELKLHEPNYPTHDLELAFIVYTCKILRQYLVGKNCGSYMDHKSIKYI